MARDRATGLISLVIGLAVMIYSFTLPVIQDDIGPAAFPRISALLLIACGIRLIISNTKMQPFLEGKDAWNRFIVISVLYILYGVAMWAAGFIPSSLIACFIFSKMMSKGQNVSYVKIIIYDILVVGIIYYVFTNTLGMPLPAGILLEGF